MALEKNKVRCKECQWQGVTKELDTVVDPRPPVGQVGDTWVICPSCRTPENIVSLCDEPNCKVEATCGAPVEGVYRWTCYDHSHWPLRKAVCQ